METKEPKYVELPPVRVTCYFCGKEKEFTTMVRAISLTPDHGAGFIDQSLCECGAEISLAIHIRK